MAKSISSMADDILGGALSNPTKNPYDPNADKPLMDPRDKLIDMTDAQRVALMEGVGIETNKPPKEETKSLVITEADLEILGKAKEIIEKIQEATTVGNIGVNFANAKQVINTKVKKRDKKKKVTNDFLTYLNPR